MDNKKNPDAAAPPVGRPAENAPEADAGKDPEREKQHRRRMRALRSILIRLGALLLVVYILFFHLVGLTVMPSNDMYPRVDGGDLLLYYRLEARYRARDIVVFEKPTESLELSYAQGGLAEEQEARQKNFFRRALDWLGFRDPADPPMTRFVCRVVAGPGDTVEISEGERLIVNGNTIVDSSIFYPTPEYEGFVEYPLLLGENEYFVLADYRNGGADSRFFGAVRGDEIKGVVIAIMRRNGL